MAVTDMRFVVNSVQEKYEKEMCSFEGGEGHEIGKGRKSAKKKQQRIKFALTAKRASRGRLSFANLSSIFIFSLPLRYFCGDYHCVLSHVHSEKKRSTAIKGATTKCA